MKNKPEVVEKEYITPSSALIAKYRKDVFDVTNTRSKLSAILRAEKKKKSFVPKNEQGRFAQYINENLSAEEAYNEILDYLSNISEVFYNVSGDGDKNKEITVKVTPEKTQEILAMLEGYVGAVAAAKILSNNMEIPGGTFEKICKKLQEPEVLGRVLQLEEPTITLVPPVTRQEMVKAIDGNKVPSQKDETYTYELNNDDLWSGGKPEAVDAWAISIVSGVQVVKDDEAIKGTNYNRAKAWAKKYEGLGLDVMNDPRTYLTLMRQSLAAGKPVDRQNLTVLNARNLTESSLVAGGGWRDGQVHLSYAGPAYVNLHFRFRGAVRVM